MEEEQQIEENVEENQDAESEEKNQNINNQIQIPSNPREGVVESIEVFDLTDQKIENSDQIQNRNSQQELDSDQNIQDRYMNKFNDEEAQKQHEMFILTIEQTYSSYLPITQYSQYANTLKSENDKEYPEILKDLKLAMRSIVKQTIFDVANIQTFINTQLVHYMTILMDRRYIIEKDNIMNPYLFDSFFGEVLRFCFDMFNSNYTGIQTILRKITNSKESYYNHHLSTEGMMLEYQKTMMERFNRQQLARYTIFVEQKKDLLRQQKIEKARAEGRDLEAQRKQEQQERQKAIEKEIQQFRKLIPSYATEYGKMKYASQNPVVQKPQFTEEELETMGIDFKRRVYRKLVYPPRDTVIKEHQFRFPNSSSPPFFMLGIDRMYREGGLKIFEHVLRKSENLSKISLVLDIIDNIYAYLKDQILDEFILSLIEDIQTLPTRISEEDLKNYSKNDLKIIFSQVQSLLRPVLKENLYNFTDQMELEFNLRCFRLSYFEKKIFAVQNIISKITNAKNNDRMAEFSVVTFDETAIAGMSSLNSPSVPENHGRNEKGENKNHKNLVLDMFDIGSNIKGNGKKNLFLTNAPNSSTNRWLNSKTYIEWLEDKGIFEGIFSESAHPEMISRAQPLLKFLYQNDKLDKNRIKLIMDLAIGKHDAIRTKILSVLAEIVKSLQVEDLEYVYEKLHLVKLNEIDLDTLNVFQAMGTNKNLDMSVILRKKNFENKQAAGGSDQIEGNGLNTFNDPLNQKRERKNARDEQEAIENDQENVNPSSDNQIEKFNGDYLDEEDFPFLEENIRNLGSAQKVNDNHEHVVINIINESGQKEETDVFDLDDHKSSKRTFNTDNIDPNTDYQLQDLAPQNSKNSKINEGELNYSQEIEEESQGQENKKSNQVPPNNSDGDEGDDQKSDDDNTISKKHQNKQKNSNNQKSNQGYENHQENFGDTGGSLNNESQGQEGEQNKYSDGIQTQRVARNGGLENIPISSHPLLSNRIGVTPPGFNRQQKTQHNLSGFHTVTLRGNRQFVVQPPAPLHPFSERLLNFFWNLLVQDEIALDPIILKYVILSISEIINYLSFKKARPIIIERCLDNIRNNVSVSDTISLLQQIFLNLLTVYYPQKYCNTKQDLISFLQEEYQFTEIIAESIIIYKNSITSILLALNEQKSDISSTVSMMTLKKIKQHNETSFKLRSESQNQGETNSVKDNLDMKGEGVEEQKKSENIAAEKFEQEQALVEVVHDGDECEAALFPSGTTRFTIGQCKSKEEIIALYNRELENRLNFLRQISENGELKLDVRVVRLLYKTLVENHINEVEIDNFFGFFTSCAQTAISSSSGSLLNEETVQFIFLEILLKLDTEAYRPKIFSTLEIFFRFVNYEFKILQQGNHGDFYFQQREHAYTIIDHRMTGIENIWHLFFNSRNEEVYSKSRDILMQIIKYRYKSYEVFQKFHQSYIEAIMSNLSKNFLILKSHKAINKAHIKSDQAPLNQQKIEEEIKAEEKGTGETNETNEIQIAISSIVRSFQLICRLIEELETPKQNSLSGTNSNSRGVGSSRNGNMNSLQIQLDYDDNFIMDETVNVKVKSNLGNVKTKMFNMTILMKWTVKDLNEILCNQMGGDMNSKDVELMVRGTPLVNEDFTLEQIQRTNQLFTPDCTIFLNQKSNTIFDDPTVPLALTNGGGNEPLAITDGRTDEDNAHDNMNDMYTPLKNAEPSDLLEKIDQIQSIINDPEKSDEFIKYVLEQKFYDVNEAIMDFFDPEQLNELLIAHLSREDSHTMTGGGVGGQQEDNEITKAERQHRQNQLLNNGKNHDQIEGGNANDQNSNIKPNEEQKQRQLTQDEIQRRDQPFSVVFANTGAYFQMFFQLLDLQVLQINTIIWQLLNLMPVNQEIRVKIETLGGTLLKKAQIISENQTINNQIAVGDHQNHVNNPASGGEDENNNAIIISHDDDFGIDYNPNSDNEFNENEFNFIHEINSASQNQSPMQPQQQQQIQQSQINNNNNFNSNFGVSGFPPGLMMKKSDSIQSSNSFSPPLNWTEIFDINHTFQLLYQLNLLKAMMVFTRFDGDNEHNIREFRHHLEWRAQFIELGGFSFIITLFMNRDPQEISAKSVELFKERELREIALEALELSQQESSKQSVKESKSLGNFPPQNTANTKSSNNNNYSSINNQFILLNSVLIDIIRLLLDPFWLSKYERGSNDFQRISASIYFSDESQDPYKNLLNTNQDKASSGSFSKNRTSSVSSVSQSTPTFQSPINSRPTSANKTNQVPVQVNVDLIGHTQMPIEIPNIIVNDDSFSRNDNKIVPEKVQQENQEKQVYDQLDEFSQKIRQTASLQENFTKNLDVKQMIGKLNLMMKEVKVFVLFDEDHANLLEYILELLVPLVISEQVQDLLGELYESQILDEIISEILSQCDRQSTRKIVAKAILTFCKHLTTRVPETISIQERFKKRVKTNNWVTGTDMVEQKKESFDIINETTSASIISEEPLVQTPERISPTKHFLNILLPHLMNFTENKEIKYEDIFVITSQLIQSFQSEELSQMFEINPLLQKLIDALINRRIIENRYFVTEDQVLAGLMSLVQSILRVVDPKIQEMFGSTKEANQKGLVEEIYDFLFLVPSLKHGRLSESDLNLPQCQQKNTRQKAFMLLTEICKGSSKNFQLLLPQILKNHENNDFYNVDASVDVKPIHGFVGLQNLGATCYINSLLQQFYMNPDFRNCTINSQIRVQISYLNPETQQQEEHSYLFDELTQLEIENAELKLSALNSQDETLADKIPTLNINRAELIANHTVLQLQEVFANLQASVKQYIWPTQLIESIKGFDNQQINVRVQQDVNEFFNIICDKLENDLKPTNQKDLLQHVYGGTFSHQIISLEEEYPYVSQREELFLTISLDIKNKKNIYEALDLYIQGDTLQGDNAYFCEKYNRNIRALKRCCVKTLPNSLVIALKRFEFDFNTMEKQKINDYFEFPMELNMKNWTQQGILEKQKNETNLEQEQAEDQLPEESFQYRLVGVLVHSGTAESGHYYSYIQNRDQAHPSYQNPQASTSQLSLRKSSSSQGHKMSFDADLQGKKEGQSILSHGGEGILEEEEWFRFDDGYVTPFNLENIKEECFGGEYQGYKNSSSSLLDNWDTHKSKNAYILFYDRVTQIPNESTEIAQKITNEEVLDKVWKENLLYLKSKLYCDPDYFTFVQDLIAQKQFSPAVIKVPQISYEQGIIPDIQKSVQYEVLKQMEDFDLRRNNKADLDLVIQIIKNKGNIDESQSISKYLESMEILTVQLATVFSIETLAKTQDIPIFVAIMNILSDILQVYTPASFWILNFLTKNYQILREILIDCSYEDAVKSFAQVLNVALTQTLKIEQSYIDDDLQVFIYPNSTNKQKQLVYQSCTQRFGETLRNELIGDCQKTFRKSLQFFQIIKKLAESNKKYLQILLVDRFDKILIDIISDHCHANMTSNYKTLDKSIQDSIIIVFDILSMLYRAMIIKKYQDLKQPNQIYIDRDVYAEYDVFLSLEFKFDNNLIPMAKITDAPMQILKFFCYNHEEQTRKFLSKTLFSLINVSLHWKYVENHFRILNSLTSIEDDFQNLRIIMIFEKQIENTFKSSYSSDKPRIGDNLIDVLHKYMYSQTDQVYVLECLQGISDLALAHPHIKEYLLSNYQTFIWIIPYLKQFKFVPPQSQNYNYICITDPQYPSTSQIDLKREQVLDKFKDILGFVEELNDQVVGVEEENLIELNDDAIMQMNNNPSNPDASPLYPNLSFNVNPPSSNMGPMVNLSVDYDIEAINSRNLNSNQNNHVINNDNMTDNATGDPSSFENQQ